MKFALLGLATTCAASLAASNQASAATNPLDLSNVYKSISCVSSDSRQVNYDGTSRKVTLSSSVGSETYSLVHLKKTTSGAELLGRSPTSGQHLLAFINLPNGKTLVQVDGKSFYATCTLIPM